MPAPRSAPGRETPLRRAVLGVLGGANDHPTATEVLARVRQVHPRTGAATVYRALALLVRTGRVQELVLDDNAGTRFDANTDAHDHVVCTGCGRVDDITPQLPSGRLRSLAEQTGFALTDYELRFHGYCPHCAESLQRGQE